MKLLSLLKYADIISDLLKKYSKYFTEEELNYIQQQIPRSYLPWALKNYEYLIDIADMMLPIPHNNQDKHKYLQILHDTFIEDLPTYRNYLQEFENHKQDLRNNNISININDYNLESLKDLINSRYINKEKWTEAFDIEQLRNSVPVAFEDENWIIFTPQTEEQASEVGKNTDWCTVDKIIEREEGGTGEFHDLQTGEWREPRNQIEQDWVNTFNYRNERPREENFTIQNMLSSYLSENNPIYDLVNKNTKRRWQYDKASGMFFTEDDQETDFIEFANLYRNQITEELQQFLADTSGNVILSYIGDTNSPEFKAILNFSPYATPEDIPHYLYDCYRFFTEKGDEAYKSFINTVLTKVIAAGIITSVKEIQEYYLSVKNNPNDVDYDSILEVEFVLIMLDALPSDNILSQQEKKLSQERTAGVLDTLKNLYQKVFKSPTPEEQEVEVPAAPDIQPSIAPIETPYFSKNLPPNISSEDMQPVAKPVGPPPTPSGDLRPWQLAIPEDYNPKNDHSYNTFKYLYLLGYRDATWYLAESHDEEDKCDELNTMSFTTDWLLFAAQHNPPSPIYSRSHPDCRCFVRCNPPSSAEEISDNAPGLPLYGTQDQILEFKRKIFANLVPIDVDAQTMAPPEEHYSNLFSSKRKYAEEINWKENITPIRTKSNFRLLLPLGLYRPMVDEYTGIILESNDFISKVYLYDLNRIVYIPTELTNPLQIQQSSDIKVEPGQYVYIDENKTLGIVTRILDNKTYCFIPDFDGIFEVDSYTPLTF